VPARKPREVPQIAFHCPPLASGAGIGSIQRRSILTVVSGAGFASNVSDEKARCEVVEQPLRCRGPSRNLADAARRPALHPLGATACGPFRVDLERKPRCGRNVVVPQPCASTVSGKPGVEHCSGEPFTATGNDLVERPRAIRDLLAGGA